MPARATSKRGVSARNVFLVVGLLALVLAWWLSSRTGLPWYPTWLAAASVVTFAAYGADKGLARKEARRIPEATLHLLALVGGFPGAWAGRSVFRHKTLKPVFLWVLWGSTLLHLGGVLWKLRG